jgi:hypothetical protein
MIEAYRARGEAEAHVIKGLLESYGIHCIMRSEAAPSVHAFTINGIGEVRIMVNASAAEKAKELIAGENDA